MSLIEDVSLLQSKIIINKIIKSFVSFSINSRNSKEINSKKKIWLREIVCHINFKHISLSRTIKISEINILWDFYFHFRMKYVLYAEIFERYRQFYKFPISITKQILITIKDRVSSNGI